MCRVLVRQSHRPSAALAEDLADPFAFQQLDGELAQGGIKAEETGFDFGNLLGESAGSLNMTDDDFDLLALLGNPPAGPFQQVETASELSSSGSDVPTQGAYAQQAYTSTPAQAGPVLPFAVPAAPMPAAPLAPSAPYAASAPAVSPAAAAYQQALAQAALAQRRSVETGLPAPKGAIAAPVPPPFQAGVPAASAGGRRSRSAAEVAAQIERTKKRRRESAQRSRTRRNCYMKALEDENGALRAELAELRSRLGMPPPSNGPAETLSQGTADGRRLAAAQAAAFAAHENLSTDQDDFTEDEAGL